MGIIKQLWDIHMLEYFASMQKKYLTIFNEMGTCL